MKTNIKLESRNWPRENAKHTKKEGLLLEVAGWPEFSPLKSLLRSSFCALCVLLWQNALAEVHYVDVNSTNATPPYTNWITAATNIQDAVDAAVAGDEIVVTNGTYSTGGDGFNRVGVGKPLNVRSVNGPQFTTINGGGQFRCVNLGSNAVLTGFTLTNGYALHGGGAQGGTLNNCTLSGNSAYLAGGQTASGGGAALCTLNNCTLSGNSVSGVFAYGGGAAFCTLNNCTLSGNSTSRLSSAGSGGGAYKCALNNCTLTTNSADFGGGAANCTLNNCTLSSNYYVADSVLGGGGGAGNCTLNNCTLTGNNSFHYGGGTYGGTLNNCTLTGNSAGSGFGGGAYGGTLNNCIVYFNTATYDANFSLSQSQSVTVLNNCCTTPQPANGVNITNAPLFVDTNGWSNLRLQPNSPCINAGNNSYVTNATDLDGNRRISGGTVDIGAYEFQSPSSMISYAWLQQFNLPINPATDTADPDGDAVDNYHEWLAGTDPTNPYSFPAQLTIIPSGTNVVLSWPTNAVGFSLQSTTSLGAVWSTNSSAPVVIDGRHVVTNPLAGPQQFYRLRQ